MPKNPDRSAQGGDVEGEISIDVTHGDAINVAKASFEPGYDSIDRTIDEGHVNKADLMRGFCSYGKAVGDAGKD